MTPIQGIVLAGGKSSRFGQDKALAMVQGVPMIQRAADVLSGLGLEVCVITSQAREYSFLNCRIERDIIPEKGPLGGLLTAFSCVKKKALLVLTCDMPMVSDVTLRPLIEAYQDNDCITLYQIKKDMPEPFPGIYSCRLVPRIQECLDRNCLSMNALIRSIPNRKTLPARKKSGFFVNVNNKNEYVNVLSAVYMN